MEGKRKISKAKGVEICADMIFAGDARKKIVKHFTETYGVSTSAVEKWMKAARPLLERRRQDAEKEIAKHAGGRPRHYNTAKELQTEIDNYFEHIKGERGTKVDETGIVEWMRPPEYCTVTGLAYYLGFESRQSVYDYEKDGQFSYVIKKARLKIESGYEQRLYSQSPTGAIFALKNMGWKDKTEQDLNLSGALVWNETKTYDPDQKADTGD